MLYFSFHCLIFLTSSSISLYSSSLIVQSSKYRRAVNALEGTCAVLGTTCIIAGGIGAGLLASGVGIVPGIVLEGITTGAGILDIIGVAVSRRCSAKVAKHNNIRVLAETKLDTVHSHISKALEDCTISDDEYKLILDEVKKYQAMKAEIQHSTPTAKCLDETTKNELIQRGRNEGRAAVLTQLNGIASTSL